MTLLTSQSILLSFLTNYTNGCSWFIESRSHMALMSPVMMNASVELYTVVVLRVFSMQLAISFFSVALGVELLSFSCREFRNGDTN